MRTNIEEHASLDLLVPTQGDLVDYGILTGSGIVTTSLDDGDLDHWLPVYYEGNLNGAVNLYELRGRYRVAASRLVQHYPTVAMIWLPRREALARFRCIGKYWVELRELEVRDRDAYRDWEAAWMPVSRPQQALLC